MCERETAKYRVIHTDAGNCYEFFCELSNALVCTTKPLFAKNEEEELMLAWESEGREHFNRCRKCGKWVIGTMFNPDVLSCVECTPIEEYPNFCPECGAKTPTMAYFCHICGKRLLYGGEEKNEDTKCG